MKKEWIFNLVAILLLAGLIFLFYRVTGGNWTGWLDGLKTGNPVDSIFGGLMNGIQSVGDGIGNAFRGLKP